MTRSFAVQHKKLLLLTILVCTHYIVNAGVACMVVPPLNRAAIVHNLFDLDLTLLRG